MVCQNPLVIPNTRESKVVVLEKILEEDDGPDACAFVTLVTLL